MQRWDFYTQTVTSTAYREMSLTALNLNINSQLLNN